MGRYSTLATFAENGAFATANFLWFKPSVCDYKAKSAKNATAK